MSVKIGFLQKKPKRRRDAKAQGAVVVTRCQTGRQEGPHQGISEALQVASGMEFEVLSDGQVLIEFFGDDGETFNMQIVQPNVIETLPIVTTLVRIALAQGSEALTELTEKLDYEGLIKLATLTLLAGPEESAKQALSHVRKAKS